MTAALSRPDRWTLPDSWSWSTMGQIAEVVGGGTPSTSEPANWNGRVPWITPADLSGYTGKTIASGARTISERGLADSGARMLPAGSVLMSSRAPVGYVAIATNSLSTNQGFKSFVLRPSVLPDYVYWYLKGSRDLLHEFASGTTFPEISGRRAAEVPIPMPPLAEQRRIVAALEEHLSDLDAAVAGLKRAQMNTRRLLAALIEYRVAAIAASTSTAAEFLRDLVDVLDQGWSPSCDSTPASGEEWGVIKTTAVQPLCFQAEANKRLPTALTPRPALALRAGDLLLTRAGPRGRVGVSCVVPNDQPRLMNCDKVYRVRVRRSRVRPGYVAVVLNAPSYLRRLDQAKTGISDSGVNLTQDRFLDLHVPVPSLLEQEELLAEVATHQSVITRTAAEIDIQLARAARLKQAILKRAFEGKLVPQDPSDEPASVLLERIRAGQTPQRAKPRRSTTNVL